MLKRLIAFLFAALAGLPTAADAGARRFTYIYEATTGTPGSVDIENWVTFAACTPNDAHFREAAFRHEIEFGVTERLRASLYLADWQYDRAETTRYTGSALELLYNITNPVTDPVGLALYQEYKIGRRLFGWESKVIAQKNFARWVTAYNAAIEAEWEGRGLRESNGEFRQSLGLSYEVSPHLAVGVEAVHEIAFPEWEAGRGRAFAGPNASVRVRNWWATITGLEQLTSDGDEPVFQVRTIVGVMF